MKHCNLKKSAAEKVILVKQRAVHNPNTSVAFLFKSKRKTIASHTKFGHQIRHLRCQSNHSRIPIDLIPRLTLLNMQIRKCDNYYLIIDSITLNHMPIYHIVITRPSINHVCANHLIRSKRHLRNILRQPFVWSMSFNHSPHPPPPANVRMGIWKCRAHNPSPFNPLSRPSETQVFD